MTNLKCYLVLSKKGSKISTRKIAQRKPSLAADEALIRLELEIPDDVFEAPSFTVEVERRQVAVAVEAGDPE